MYCHLLPPDDNPIAVNKYININVCLGTRSGTSFQAFHSQCRI